MASSIIAMQQIKSVEYTGTTNSVGKIEGGLNTFGINDGTMVLRAFFVRGSFTARRKVDVYDYGNSGLGLEFSDNGSPVNNQSVTAILYYI